MIFKHLCYDQKVLNNEMFRWHLLAIRLNGYINCDEDRFKYFHFVRGLCNVVIFLVALGFDAAFLLTKDADAQTATLVAAIFIVFLNIIVKTFAFYFYRETNFEMINKARNWIEHLKQNGVNEIQSIYQMHLKNSKQTSAIIGILLFCSSSLNIVNAVYFIFSNFNDITQGALNPNTTLPEMFYMHPNKAFTDNIVLAYVFPCYMEAFGSLGVYTWTSFYTGFMKYAVCRLDIIRYKLEHLTDFYGQYGSPLISQEIQKYTSSKRLLIECKIELVDVRVFVTKFEETTKVALFLESSTTAALLCFIVYNVLQDIKYEEAAVVVLWVLITFGVLFVNYWNANEIAIKSDIIGTSLYVSNWYELPLLIQKDVLVFMSGCVKPIIITAVLFTMNTGNFAAILKTSYTCFTVLTTMAN